MSLPTSLSANAVTTAVLTAMAAQAARIKGLVRKKVLRLQKAAAPLLPLRKAVPYHRMILRVVAILKKVLREVMAAALGVTPLRKAL